MEWINVAERRLAEELDLLSDAKWGLPKSSRASTRSKKSSVSSTSLLNYKLRETCKNASRQYELQMKP